MAGIFTPISGTTLPDAFVGVPYFQNISYSPNGTTQDWQHNLPAGFLPFSWTGTGPQIFVDTDINIVLPDIKPFTASCTFTSTGVCTFTITGFDDNLQPIVTGQFIVNVLRNPNAKKKRRISAPETFCCNPEQFRDKVCPPTVNMNGYYYARIKDSNCYIKLKK